MFFQIGLSSEGGGSVILILLACLASAECVLRTFKSLQEEAVLSMPELSVVHTVAIN